MEWTPGVLFSSLIKNDQLCNLTLRNSAEKHIEWSYLRASISEIQDFKKITKTFNIYTTELGLQT